MKTVSCTSHSQHIRLGNREIPVGEELRSQSLPNCLLDNTSRNSQWFKTWPERCTDKMMNNNTQAKSTANTHCDMIIKKRNKVKLSFKEALQNISIAYSPITKQLHLVTSEQDHNHAISAGQNTAKGHKRSQASSFSSTISSLSDSHSLLDINERSSLEDCNHDNKKSNRITVTQFFAKNVLKLFGKPSGDNSPSSPRHVASSTALIQHPRPSSLPAKNDEEDRRHRNEYKAIIAAAKKKEAQILVAKQKLQQKQLKLEEQQATATQHFVKHVLPNWDLTYDDKKTRDLWWQGLPSSVRGKIWQLAIGNELNITSELYEICLKRAHSRLKNHKEVGNDDRGISQESSMEVIELDIARTFPHWGIFQRGGPYSANLHSLLAAYVCYRPDVGYVQGMSYIAAILLLNMDVVEAFICFANLLNRPLHMAAFSLNQKQMQAYYQAYNQLFSYNFPKLHRHFESGNLTADLYLLDWIYTIFAKAMALDVACRVWDVFLRDGSEFIFRTALGILHLHQDILMDMDFLHGAQFLTHLPNDLSSQQLFKSIEAVTMCIGKQSFHQIVEKLNE